MIVRIDKHDTFLTFRPQSPRHLDCLRGSGRCVADQNLGLFVSLVVLFPCDLPGETFTWAISITLAQSPDFIPATGNSTDPEKMATQQNSKSHSIRLHTTIDAVRPYAKDWDRLAGGVPFRMWSWHSAWLRQYTDRGQLFVLTVHENDSAGNIGDCIGVAPFYLDGGHVVGPVIRFIGSGEACSDYQTLLAQRNHAETVGAEIARWLAMNAQGTADSNSKTQDFKGAAVPSWSLLQLEGIDLNCPAMKKLVSELELAQFTLHRRTSLSTWRISLPSSMDEYIASLSKSCRRKVRTAVKKFDAGEYIANFAETEEQFDQIWGSLVDLHQRRRKSLGENGSFTGHRLEKFLLEAARKFHADGLLELASVSIDSKTIATEISFRGSSVTYAYQIGIDPDHLKENPGWLVNAASIRRANFAGSVRI